VQTTTLQAGNQTVGNVSTWNDAQFLYVQITTSGGWTLSASNIFVGDCNNVPTGTNIGYGGYGGHGGYCGPKNNNNNNPFNYRNNHPRGTNTYTLTVPLAEVQSCFCVAVRVTVSRFRNRCNQTETAWANGTRVSNHYGNNAQFFSYCIQACPPPPPPPDTTPVFVCNLEPGQYRTQSQASWGAMPDGSNAATYLHTNFAAAFPNGLTVGGNFSITLTSAQAVTDFLPVGGVAQPLTQNLTNPTSLFNTLAGQVVALTLTVTFDQVDPSFGASKFLLRDLIMDQGPFAGWTVGAILAEANTVLGGGASSFTAAQLSSALATINANFEDGFSNNLFLTCPGAAL